MRFGVLDINPARNPAVLDTATWDRPGAARCAGQVPASFWAGLPAAAAAAAPLSAGGLTVHPHSISRLAGRTLGLASLDDGQHVFVELGAGPAPVLGDPLATTPLAGGEHVVRELVDEPLAPAELADGLAIELQRVLLQGLLEPPARGVRLDLRVQLGVADLEGPPLRPPGPTQTSAQAEVLRHLLSGQVVGRRPVHRQYNRRLQGRSFTSLRIG